MRSLFASTCLTPIAFGLFASSATAATVTIGATQTTPVATSTANAGAPADISITSAGAINPASGNAVTIDSNNSVTNAGGITIKEANNTNGILANAGVTGSITNSGTITVSEAYVQTDSNADGVLDGPFAQGSNRFGIHTAGAFTGSIANSGTIAIQGNNSAGIALDGALTGSLSQTGTINVVGDGSAGIRAGAISGSASINGTITAKGNNAVGVALNGDIGGALVVQATITSTGFSSTTLPTDTTKLIPSQNLLQGGPAMQIGGNVAGGVLLTGATSTTNSSGNTVTTTAASLVSYGSAPALLIGSGQAITLGAVASDANKNGLVINGSVVGGGVYDGVAANGLVIGGQGGSVSIANGMAVGGTVAASSNDASATGIRIGSGATAPTATVTGSVSAAGSSKATDTSVAFQIDSGATLSNITNSGSIKAVAAGTASSATAILDKSGTLALVTNSGVISAAGGATNVAIDLSAATGATQVNQIAPSTGTAVPSIIGDVKFGSGNDQFTLAAGSMAGNTSFGAGTNTLALSNAATYAGNVSFGAGNDTMSLAGTSTFAGRADFGGGSGSLTVGGTASFSGTLANSGGVALAVSGGTVNLTSTGNTALASLAVTGGGTLGITVDAAGNATHYVIAGAASFDTASKLALHFIDLAHTAGTYTVVTAGSVSGVNNITTTGATLPYLFKSSVATSVGGNGVDVVVARKTATELGLNRSLSSAYDAIYTAISADKPVGGAFLSINDAPTLTRSLRELLPDHAGGAFDTVSSASRATARILADPELAARRRGQLGLLDPAGRLGPHQGDRRYVGLSCHRLGRVGRSGNPGRQYRPFRSVGGLSRRAGQRQRHAQRGQRQPV